ncbi:phage head-tail joining protein [Pseudochelatococcus sp. G4_1912]|uniref:phage head-tail joining protein n=1 Tax=Pseudochelatococcus sp. G4_1912 TaxID=3114288 RepID=UPI0039C717BE
MSSIDDRIAALTEAIAMGAKRVTFHSGGTRREVEYHSLKEMQDLLDRLKAEQALAQRRKSPIILVAN